VLGGSFAEGIDLPGDRLIGAFIATLGLPQINPVNEQIRERMGANFGAAQSYDYTYLYPGLQKVVQAAGRVIRTTSDRGVVYLIDDRFTRPEIQSLLPGWWKVTRCAPGAGNQPPHCKPPRKKPADAGFCLNGREGRSTLRGLKHAQQHQDEDDAKRNAE
jgi:hypothetical protein